MANFVCTDCGYNFESEKENALCPYCGKGHAEREKSAEELVDVVKVE